MPIPTKPKTEPKQAQQALLQAFAAESRGLDEARMPKYLRVSKVLQKMVDRGFWKSGDQLPAEGDMARILDVSLGTMQKALGLMAGKGVLVREHGRGTFVTGGQTPQEDVWYFRFSADDREKLLPVYSRVLDIGITEAEGSWSAFLSGAESYVRIRRLMSVNHEFSIYSEVYLDAGKYGSMVSHPVKKLHGTAIYRLLDELFDAPTRRVAQHLRFVRMPATVAEHLETEPGGALLELTIMSYDIGDTPLMYQIAYVPPNDRVMQVSDMTLSRTRSVTGGLKGQEPQPFVRGLSG